VAGTFRRVLTPDVLVVGAGPAGLSVAARLAPRVAGGVLVLDRERDAGGVPRYCAHTGFGVRDLHRVLTGPAYARRLVDQALAAGAEVRTEATATGWVGEHAVEVTSPQGRFAVEARAVVLATGARERGRPGRMIAGDRPATGVLTTGQLQQLGDGQHCPVGERAVVVGAELVSWSAVLSLRAAGCRTVLMTTEYPRPDSPSSFTVPGRLLLRVPVATRVRVRAIHGRERVEAVELEHLDTRARRRFGCDTVVLTGDWVPEHELARLTGLDLDAGSLGPVVDTALGTSRPGVFAAGDLVHPADVADVAVLDGRHVADQVVGWLAAGEPRAEGVRAEGVRLVAEQPLRWVAPGRWRAGDPAPPRGLLLARTDLFVRAPRVRVVQDGAVRAECAPDGPAAPGRLFRIPAQVLDGLDPEGGPATIGLR
jgi:thioredoxin reductase